MSDVSGALGLAFGALVAALRKDGASEAEVCDMTIQALAAYGRRLSPELAGEIREAVDASGRGETVDRGDFTQYAGEDQHGD